MAYVIICDTCEATVKLTAIQPVLPFRWVSVVSNSNYVFCGLPCASEWLKGRAGETVEKTPH